MSGTIDIQRGDILIVNFEPVKGSEQGKTRPALVIQNDIGNKYSPTTIVAAITSKEAAKDYPTCVSISKEDSKLEKNSTVLLNQIRTIDKLRITKRVSSLPPLIMKKVDLALNISLGLE